MIKVAKKPLTTTLVLIAVIGMIFYMSFSSSSLEYNLPKQLNKYSETVTNHQDPIVMSEEKVQVSNAQSSNKDSEANSIDTTGSSTTNKLQSSLELTETPFMPKMANETLKAQLGNAAWKLLHTILARYPDTPTKQERTTLSSYIQLFGQVYPCGDCARHFQVLLSKYPPQTGSRKTAAMWGCDIHNKVNERLGKPIYDCGTILEDYDCGCGSDEKDEDTTLGNKSLQQLKVEKEDKQLGG